MALSVDWDNRLIMSDASITDMVSFHFDLRALEASVIGILYPGILTYKETQIGGGAIFPAVAFINSWRLKFPTAGSYVISGGNLAADIIPVAGVYVERQSSAAYAVTAIGAEGATPADIAAAVWDQQTNTRTAQGSFGLAVQKLLTKIGFIALND